MTNIYDIRKHRKSKQKYDNQVQELVNLGGDIDKVIIEYLTKNLDPKEVAVIVGHRLSELLRLLKKDRHMVWDTVESIIRERIK